MKAKAMYMDEFLAIICESQKIKKAVYEFYFSLIEIKKKIKPLVEEYADKMAVLQEETKTLVAEYCEKDDAGKAIVLDDKYQGLHRGQQPEYDKRIAEVSKEALRLQNEELEADLEGIKIKKSALPLDMDGIQQEYLQEFITD